MIDFHFQQNPARSADITTGEGSLGSNGNTTAMHQHRLGNCEASDSSIYPSALFWSLCVCVCLSRGDVSRMRRSSYR